MQLLQCISYIILGAIVALPIALFRLFWTEKEAYPGFSSKPQGIVQWLKRIIALKYLKYCKKKRIRRRLDFCELPKTNKHYLFGFQVPPQEWQMDAPRPIKKPLQEVDESFFYGVNADGCGFVARIARWSENQAEVWLYIKLADGREYELPCCKPVAVYSKDPFIFRGGGLKMECREPMRRWRISYNGVMKQVRPKNVANEEPLVHMKFSFLWLSLSSLYDMDDDAHPELQASLLARESLSTMISILKHASETKSDDVERFEQAGQLIGTFSVDGASEEEMYMWGTRARIHETRNIESESSSITRVFGYDKYGSFFHFGYSFPENGQFRLHYGYVMQANGHLHPFESYDVLSILTKEGQNCPEKIKINFYAHKNYTMCISPLDQGIKFKHLLGETGETNVHLTKITVNKFPGEGLLMIENRVMNGTKESCKNYDNYTKIVDQASFVIAFHNPLCKNVQLAGGKGASLAVLKEASLASNVTESPTFTVPDGIVVTTNAYKKVIMENQRLIQAIHNLESVAWGKTQGVLQEECDKVIREFKTLHLPDEICEDITVKLREMFGNKLDHCKFAVRSSGSGEDSEDLSAAGQMDTFLGVQTLDKIFSVVMNCWASQFGLVAVNYKKSYGQLLNMDMAVVIQEMVESEVAGVMFTCNPVSGDPKIIHITANYGLGESVVSASAEPDTVTLKRDYRNEVTLDEVHIGSKKMCIVMDKGDGGTHEEQLASEDASRCCLSEEKALLLAKIGIHVEEIYGSVRDIEWAVAKDRIFLLQSRPVTSIDNETDFEIMHNLDTGHITNSEYWSKANVGEVMPGCVSPFGLPFCFKMFFVGLYDLMKIIDLRHQKGIRRYYMPGMGFSLFQVFFNLLEADFELQKGKKSNSMTRSMTISMMGRLINIEDEGIVELCAERRFSKSAWLGIQVLFNAIKNQYYCDQNLERAVKEVWNMYIPSDKCNSAKEYFTAIGNHFVSCHKPMQAFFHATMNSSMINGLVLTVLNSNTSDFSNDVYSDFANLLSSCPTVESADVPTAMKRFGAAIAKEMDAEEFKKLPVEEALKWVESSTSAVGKAFQEFIERHGHRCLKEFDVYSHPWREDKRQLIESIQAIVSLDPEGGKKEEISVNEAISRVQVPLSWFKRFLLKLLLPFCRKAVSQRELGKSVLIKTVDVYRRAFWKLAEMLEKEGYLPERELLFFLNLEELELLMKTRNPRLIARAKRRRKILPELNDSRFPEIFKGPIRPMKFSAQLQNGHSSSLVMNGVPVSRGVIKGRARVANNLQEAAALKPGEILITYSTDIGWSPYFPLISGLATELGGLISHGAVIAREYGLPCVVGLHGATSLFHSGDLVILDGTNGILKKIDEEGDAASTGS